MSATGSPRSLNRSLKNKSTSGLLRSQSKTDGVLTRSSGHTPQLLFEKEDIFTCDINERCVIFGNARGMVEVFDADPPHLKDKNLCLASSRGENILSSVLVGPNLVVTGDTMGNVCLYRKFQNILEHFGILNSTKMWIGKFDKNIPFWRVANENTRNMYGKHSKIG